MKVKEMTLTIESVIRCEKPRMPMRKWYSALPVKVRLQGEKVSRRMYAYAVGNNATVFIQYKGDLYALQSSFGPDAGDTLELWSSKGTWKR